MKTFFTVAMAAGFLLAATTATLAGPNVGQRPLGSYGRALAAERGQERKPYALAGQHGQRMSWESEVGPSPSGRARMISFKRTTSGS